MGKSFIEICDEIGAEIMEKIEAKDEQAALDLVDELVAFGGSVAYRCFYGKETLLSGAVGQDMVTLARELIRNDADINKRYKTRTSQGPSFDLTTPLFKAAVVRKNADMTAMLVEEGASLELICNYTGKSIFDVANEDMIDVILQAQRSPARAEGLKKTHVREKDYSDECAIREGQQFINVSQEEVLAVVFNTGHADNEKDLIEKRRAEIAHLRDYDPSLDELEGNRRERFMQRMEAYVRNTISEAIGLD